jgi:hypothetical protein
MERVTLIEYLRHSAGERRKKVGIAADQPFGKALEELEIFSRKATFDLNHTPTLHPPERADQCCELPRPSTASD